MIYAENQENIIIEGPGKLKGNGATYCFEAQDTSPFYPLDTFNLKTFVREHRKRIMFAKEDEMTRDFIMAVNYCRNVTVRNPEIYESGSWTCRMEGNENLLFERVVINNNVRVANSDGIDIMGGKNTVIKNCFIATGDDAICLKADPGNDVLEDVVIENCELMSLANCFKAGTATCNDIKNVLIRNCYMFMPGIAGGYAGISIQSTDGATTKNIRCENITMENITTPFVIWLGYREKGSRLSDIVIKNIFADNCDIASSITGFKKHGEIHYAENITIENINVTYRQAKEKTCIYKGNDAYDGYLNMGGYPESTRISHMYILNHEKSLYYDLPVYGLFVRNAKNVKVRKFNVVPRRSNKRNMTNTDKPEKYNLSNCSIL